MSPFHSRYPSPHTHSTSIAESNNSCSSASCVLHQPCQRAAVKIQLNAQLSILLVPDSAAPVNPTSTAMSRSSSREGPAEAANDEQAQPRRIELPNSSQRPTTVPANRQRPQRRKRRQSLKREAYKKDAQERMQDVPFCPPPEEMFKPKRQNQSEEDEEEDTLTGPSEIDPYIEVRSRSLAPPATTTTATLEGRRPHRQHLPIFEPARKSRSSSDADASTGQRRTTSHDSGYIKRELRLALVTQKAHTSRSESQVAAPSSMNSGEHDLAMPSREPPNRSRSNSIEVYDDDFDCCYQLWNLLLKLMSFLISAVQFVIDHKALYYPLAFLFFYLCLGTLHTIMASLMASLAGITWPPAHFCLSTTAGFVWRLADWLTWIDELGRSLICDMAQNYCRRYRLLCDRQCSFVDQLEHRSRRCF